MSREKGSSGIGKLFFGIFLGILLSFALIFGAGCLVYYKGSINWVNSFGANVSSGSEKLDNMTVREIINTGIKVYNNYNNLSLDDVAEEFGYSLPTEIYGIDITDITSAEITNISTAVQDKLNNISASELEEVMDLSSIESILNSEREFYLFEGKLYEDETHQNLVDFDYELTENGGVYTIEVKSQTFTVSENKVGITVKYLPLTYAFGDVESFTIADVMGYTIDEDTGKVTDKDGEEVTGIMKAFADKKIGELTTAIDTLTLVDVFGEVDENSVFTLIEGYETLPISQVPDKLVEAVSNSTINELVNKGVISSSSVESLNDTLKAKTVNELISSLSNVMGKTLAELDAEGLIEIDIESYPNLANKTLEDILDLAEEASSVVSNG